MDSDSGDSRHSATFNLVLKNFTNSLTKNHRITSLPCKIRNIPWRLQANLETKKNEWNTHEKYLGISIQCLADDESESDCVCHLHWNCLAKVKISVLHTSDKDKNAVREFSHVFHSDYRTPKYDDFISWDSVTNPRNGFIEQNTVYIQAEVTVGSAVGIKYNVKNDENKSKLELLESQKRVLSLESEVAQLKSDLNVEKCNVLHLRKDLADEKSELQQLKNNVAEEKTELQVLKNDFVNEKAEVQRLKNDLANEKADTQSKIKILETLVTNLVLQISDLKKTKESVTQSQNASNNSSTEDLRSEVRDVLLSLLSPK